jgi:hypothetical protein
MLREDKRAHIEKQLKAKTPIYTDAFTATTRAGS